MVIFTKYSNERRKEFRIRTDILQAPDGTRTIRKTAADPAAAGYIRGIFEKFFLLKKELEGTGLRVNECSLREDGVCFPFLTGETLEERLDGLLAKKDLDGVKREIERYFSCFAGRMPGQCSDKPGTEQTDGRRARHSDGQKAGQSAQIWNDLAAGGSVIALKPFYETPEFTEVFGPCSFARLQYGRSVSDIDMIFSNVILGEDGSEVIDYEWTFDFPVPVKFILYRCLHYYIFGDEKRAVLNACGLFGYFDINEEEQAQFARMEEHFQRYMLGDYTPIWQLYDSISEGIICLEPIIDRESRKRKQGQKIELYFDDGRGFGAWNCEKRFAPEGGAVSLLIEVAEGVRSVRFDPCGEKCVVRIQKLRQAGTDLKWTSNGLEAGDGDLIFDTEDPQVIFHPRSAGAVEVSFLVEPMDGLTRELLLKQNGKLRWMEGTKVWRLYRRLRGD